MDVRLKELPNNSTEPLFTGTPVWRRTTPWTTPVFVKTTSCAALLWPVAKSTKSRWRRYPGEWMDGLHREGINRYSKAVAGVIKR